MSRWLTVAVPHSWPHTEPEIPRPRPCRTPETLRPRHSCDGAATIALRLGYPRNQALSRWLQKNTTNAIETSHMSGLISLLRPVAALMAT